MNFNLNVIHSITPVHPFRTFVPTNLLHTALYKPYHLARPAKFKFKQPPAVRPPQAAKQPRTSPGSHESPTPVSTRRQVGGGHRRNLGANGLLVFLLFPGKARTAHHAKKRASRPTRDDQGLHQRRAYFPRSCGRGLISIIHTASVAQGTEHREAMSAESRMRLQRLHTLKDAIMDKELEIERQMMMGSQSSQGSQEHLGRQACSSPVTPTGSLVNGGQPILQAKRRGEPCTASSRFPVFFPAAHEGRQFLALATWEDAVFSVRCVPYGVGFLPCTWE